MSIENTIIEEMKENAKPEEATVVYDREVAQTAAQAEFKPGDTPHTQFGTETLNGNVPWSNIVEDIIGAHYTLEQLITETEVSIENIKQIMKKNYQKLSFRAGARLLSVHSKFYPEQYV